MKKFYDKTGNYIAIEAYTLEGVKELGIVKSVEEKITDLKTKLTESITLDKADVDVLLNVFVGTIMNTCLTEQDLKDNCVEIELPEVFTEILSTGDGPTILWNGLYFNTIITKYNQIVLSYNTDDITQTDWLCEIITE